MPSSVLTIPPVGWKASSQKTVTMMAGIMYGRKYATLNMRAPGTRSCIAAAKTVPSVIENRVVTMQMTMLLRRDSQKSGLANRP